jgi:hypothetical protein
MSRFELPARPSPRAIRLACLALAAGAAAGMAAAGDIEASYAKGRIGTVSVAAAPAAAASPVLAPAASEDPALAHAHGFALAAQRDLTRPAECRTVAPEFRAGCEDYAESRRATRAAAEAELDFAG